MSKEDYATLIEEMALYYQREVDPRTLDVWWDTLKPYYAGDIRQAWEKYRLGDHPFMPNPGQLISRCPAPHERTIETREFVQLEQARPAGRKELT